MDETPNLTFSLIITNTILIHFFLGILFDERSSSSLRYYKNLKELGLIKQDLSHVKARALKNLMILLLIHVDMCIFRSFGTGDKRIAKPKILVIVEELR